MKNVCLTINNKKRENILSIVLFLLLVLFLIIYIKDTTVSKFQWAIYIFVIFSIHLLLALPYRKIFIKSIKNIKYRVLTSKISFPNFLVILFIIVVATILRSQLLNLPVTVDESRTIVEFGNPNSTTFLDTISKYGDNNNHPLNSIATFLSVLFFNNSEPFIARLPALIVGVLTVLGVYLVGKKIFNSYGVGAVAALIVAVNPEMIKYSVLTRGYIYISLSYILMLYAVWTIYLKKTSTIFNWLLLYVSGVLGMYSNVSAIYCLSTTILWLLIVLLIEKRSSDILTLLKIGVAIGTSTVVLYSPFFLREGLRIFTNKWTHSLPLEDFLSKGYDVYLTVFSPVKIFNTWNLNFIVLFLLIIATLTEYRKFKRLPILLTLSFFLPLILIIQRPYLVSQRLYLFIVPLFAIYIGLGIMTLIRKKRSFINIILIFTTVFLVAETKVYNPNKFLQKRSADIGTSISFLMRERALSDQDSVIGYSGENWVINYYLRQNGLSPNISIINRMALSEGRQFLIVPPGKKPESIIDRHQNSFKRIDVIYLTPLIRYKYSSIYEFIKDKNNLLTLEN